MRRFVTAGILALVVALFAGCNDQESQTPTEPQFKPGNNKVSYDCEAAGLQEQLDALNEAVETIFLSRPTINGALSNIDNTARKVCVGEDEDPNYGAALEQYYELELLVNSQDISKLNGGEVARQTFLDMAYSFASGGDYNPGFSIPPEALGENGLLYVIESPDEIPAEGLDLVAEGDEGAVRIYPGTFAPENFPVTIVEYRLPDDYAGGDGYSFGDYAPFLVPEIWWFDASAQPDPSGPGFEAWVCVVEDPSDLDLWFRTQIAHAKDDGTVELLERLTENSPLDCAGATTYQTALAPSAPGWLQLASNVVRPVLKEFFAVKKLNAMYFAGTGLGGRGGSLSPFAPADVRYKLDVTISGGNGRLLIDGEVYYAQFDGIGTAVIRPYFADPGETVLVVPDPAEGYEVDTWTGCSDFDGDVCEVEMDASKSVTAVFREVVQTYSLTVTGSGDGGGTVGVSYYSDPATYETETCTYDLAAGGLFLDSGAPCSFAFPAGRVVDLIASPDGSSALGNWTGCTGSDPSSCNITMDADQTVSIPFETQGIQLEIQVAGPGSVTGTYTVGLDGSDPLPVNCTVDASPCIYSGINGISGSDVELRAEPTLPASPTLLIAWGPNEGECYWVGKVGDGDTCPFSFARSDALVNVTFYDPGPQ